MISWEWKNHAFKKMTFSTNINVKASLYHIHSHNTIPTRYLQSSRLFIIVAVLSLSLYSWGVFIISIVLFLMMTSLIRIHLKLDSLFLFHEDKNEIYEINKKRLKLNGINEESRLSNEHSLAELNWLREMHVNQTNHHLRNKIYAKSSETRTVNKRISSHSVFITFTSS